MERDKVFKAGVCDLLPARLAGPEEREGHTSYVTVRKVARRVSEINWEAVCVCARVRGSQTPELNPCAFTFLLLHHDVL